MPLAHVGSCIGYDARCRRRELRAGHHQASGGQELRYVGEFCLHVCIYTASVPGIRRGQKRTSDVLALELQMAVRPPVGAIASDSWHRIVL